MVFDGSFLRKRKETVVAIIDAQDNKPIQVSFETKENSVEDVRAFLTGLENSGLHPESVTIDGLKNVKDAFRGVWPNIIIQRCLFHIQKQGLAWCRRYPKSTEARTLRQIFRNIFFVHNHEDRRRFMSGVLSWEKTYGQKICLHPSQGWVMSDLRRARSMLLKALPDMFYFLDNPKIPKTTNCAESFFSKIKDNIKIHRGLTQEKRFALIRYVVYSCRK